MQPTPTPMPTQPMPDLVNIQKNVATLDQLIAKYNQLYQTYLQQVEYETNKRQQRKYPYNIQNPNEFKNNLTPASPFPSNGTEVACFKSCIDSNDCVYALYSNTGCGIDCNPNKCLLYGSNANGIAPVKELSSVSPSCPSSQPSVDQNSNCNNWAKSGECEKNPDYMLSSCAASCNSSATDVWCKTFNHPATNSIIPVLVIRTGGANWRSLAMQMPTSTANASDAPMTVDLNTNVQTWGPDTQFSDVNYAPTNEISLQFRFFAEYWLNAYGLASGSTPVLTAQGTIGTFAFAKMSSNAQPSSAQQCNWKDTSQCIFNGYTMSGDSCSNQGNYGYSVSGLASYSASDLMGWLQALYNNNGGYTEKAYQYWNKCKSVPGYEFLTNLNFADMGTSYVGTFGGQTMFWNSAAPSSGGVAAGLKTAAALAATSDSAKFNYNYSAFEKPVWKNTTNMNAMKDQFPPQLAKLSIPSWQFLGVQDSAEACQRAATDDPDHVYTIATYYNASYNNPQNGNNVFSRMCYGHVAGAPDSTASSASEDNVQTMTPPHGYTKLGGKPGIAILKQMYQLNKQIMALTDELKIYSNEPNELNTINPINPKKEAFTQQTDESDDGTFHSLSKLSKKLKREEANLNDAIQAHNQLDTDEANARHLLLYSRIKFGVAVVLGLLLAYFAIRFLTADELPKTIATELGQPNASASASANTGSNVNSGYGMDDTY